MRSPIHLLLLIMVLAIPSSESDATAQTRAAPDAPATTTAFATSIRRDLDLALDQFADGHNALAQTAVQDVFDRVLFHAPDDASDLFLDVESARRLIDQLSLLTPDRRRELIAVFRAAPEVSRPLLFLVRADVEDVGAIYALFERMYDRAGKFVVNYPNLAAAICVVHEQPLARNINENTTRAADPLRIFEYFIRNEGKMLFGLKNVPPELLIYVVDTTTPIEEMQWAVENYAGDEHVGQRFFDIEYDYDHLQKRTPKKYAKDGFSLPAIHRHGGVCADQAYFAVAVGKSIGVPTTYTVGRSAEVGHAWVGFMKADRNAAWWDFNTGRYEAYQGVRGIVFDPQIRTQVPDSYVGLRAELAAVTPNDRYAALSYFSAARRLLALELEDWRAEPPPIESADRDGARDTPRTRTLPVALDLVELGLRRCPGHAEGWDIIRDLATEDRLSLEQKQRWAGVLERLCGQRYPDFALAILMPMIDSIDDTEEQNRLWNRAFDLFSRRADLAAHVRYKQGRMWEAAGSLEKAGQCYEDIIARYANAGPFVIHALERAEYVLENAKRAGRVPALYKRAWNLTKKPKDMAAEFSRQSNWYNIGRQYARRLEDRGRSATAVWRALGGRR